MTDRPFRLLLCLAALSSAGFVRAAEDKDDGPRDIGVNAGNVNDAYSNFKEAKKDANAAKWKNAVEQHRQAQDAAGEKAIQDARAKMSSEEKAKEWKQTVENANRKADAAGEKAIRKVEQEKALTQEKIEKWKQVKAADDAAQTAAGEKAIRQRQLEQMTPQERIEDWKKVTAADRAAQDAANEALLRGEKPPEKAPVKATVSAQKTASAPAAGVKNWAQNEVGEFKAGVKSGVQELKAGAKDVGTYLKLAEIGDNAHKIMNAATDEERASAVKDAATGVVLDTAQAALGKSAPVLALGTAAIQAGGKASENVADYADYAREADELNYNVGIRNREERIFQDLARTQGGAGISKEEARRLAAGYVNGEAKSIEKVEEMYKDLGKTVPKQEQAERSAGQAAVDIAADTAEAGWGLIKGVGKQAVHTAEAVYQGGKETIGVVTDGALGELYDQRKEALSGDNLSAGAEVIGNDVKEGWNAGVKKVDESVEFVKDTLGLNDEKHIDEAAVEQIRETVKGWGASDVYADKVAEKFFGATTSKESAEILKAARNEFLANKAAREEAQSLREAEGGELPPAGSEALVPGNPGGGSLGSFTNDREAQLADNTAGDAGFANIVTGERQLEGWNQRTEFETRRILDEGGAKANEIGSASAAETAAAQDANSWGTAIADGVQSGVAVGLSTAGASFGAAIGDEIGHRAANSVFGDPSHKNHFDDDWQPSGGGESVTSGGDSGHEITVTQVADGNGNPVGGESTPSAKNGSTSSGSKTASSWQKGKCVGCGKKKSVNKNGLCLDCVALTVVKDAVNETVDGVRKTLEDGAENARQILRDAGNSGTTAPQSKNSQASKCTRCGTGRGYLKWQGRPGVYCAECWKNYVTPNSTAWTVQDSEKGKK